MLLIILLCIIGFLIILLIALLIFPFSLAFKLERTEAKVGYQIDIRYPWKFFGFWISSHAGQRQTRILIGNKILNEKVKRRDKKPGEKSTDTGQQKSRISTDDKSISEKGKLKEKKSKKKSRRKFGDFVEIWELIRENVKPAIQFLQDILRCFKKNRLAGELEVGVSDPALMGMLYGMYWAILWHKQHNLKVKPNFIDTTFSGWIEFETYIILLPILFAVIKLAFKVPIIKLIRLGRQRKAAKEETGLPG